MIHGHLQVVSAHGLAPTRLDSSADPYCVLEVGTWRRQSQVARSSNSPKWGDTFHLEGEQLSRARALLRLQVGRAGSRAGGNEAGLGRGQAAAPSSAWLAEQCAARTSAI